MVFISKLDFQIKKSTKSNWNLFYISDLFRRNLNNNRRLLRDRSDPLGLPEQCFKKLYRVSRDLGHWLLTQIGPYMREGERTTCIPKSLRVSSLKKNSICSIIFNF